MFRFKGLVGVMMIGAACTAATAASDEVSTGPAAGALPPPPRPITAQCPTKTAATAATNCRENVKPVPEGFAEVLLCIAKDLCDKQICCQKPCDCPPGKLAKRDRDALWQHITGTLTKLGSLEKADERKGVQKVLTTALLSDGKESQIAREVLALIASMPSKPATKVTVTTATKKQGGWWCWPADCTTTETSEVSAEPVAPAPLSTALVDKIVSKLKCQPCSPKDCDLPAPCPPSTDPCQSASCFDVRWELFNMLILDAEHQPTRDEAEIKYEIQQMRQNLKKMAKELTESDQKELAAKLDKIMDELDRDLRANEREIAKRIWNELFSDNDRSDAIRFILQSETQDLADILSKTADKLKESGEKDLAEELNRMADDLVRKANRSSAAEALMAELRRYHQRLESACPLSACDIRILLRVIDGAGDIHEPFTPGSEISAQLLLR